MKTCRMHARALAFAMAASALVACDGAERREVASLAMAVERFHRADNVGKPAAVEQLRALPCTAADVCRARDACLAAGEATAKALRLKSDVEQGLAAVERGALPKDSLEASLLASKLDQAEALLKEGFQNLPACDDQVATLKRRHHL